MPNKRRLFFDIETSPNTVLSWETGYNLTIPHDNIVKERSIICIGYKWTGEKTVHALTWDQNQSDKKMLEKFIPIMNSADEVVGHNSNHFDLKWIRTRCLKHSISTVPDYVSIDTMLLAQKRFKFNSNSLAYISKYLEVGSKIKTDYDLWKQVLLDNNKKSLKTMVDYCKNDVVILEKIWDKLNPYVLATSNFATNASHCPECGSHNTIVNKRRISAAGYKKINFQCKDCGKYHTVPESKWIKNTKIK